MGMLGIIASQITAVMTPSTNPVIHTVSHDTIKGNTNYSWYIRNMDASTATLYSDVNNSSPSTSRGSAAYNASVNAVEQLIGNVPPVTMYAKAQASGEAFSSVVSYYYEGF